MPYKKMKFDEVVIVLKEFCPIHKKNYIPHIDWTVLTHTHARKQEEKKIDGKIRHLLHFFIAYSCMHVTAFIHIAINEDDWVLKSYSCLADNYFNNVLWIDIISLYYTALMISDPYQ